MDAVQYLAMAHHPELGRKQPYSNRVLTPWLTRALSSSGADADLRSTYRAIALSCLVVTGVLVYLLVRRLGGSHPTGLLAVGGLCCSWGWLIYLQAPYLSDQAAVLLTAAAFAALTFGAVERSLSC